MNPKFNLFDASEVRITRKDQSNQPLTKEQLTAIKALVDSQGDFGVLNEKQRAALNGLQAKYGDDPGVNNFICDFSLRVISIHKTWSWFKNMSLAPGFDPSNVRADNLRMDALVKNRPRIK